MCLYLRQVGTTCMPAAPRGLKKGSGIPELKLPRHESHRVPGVRNLPGSLGEQQMRLASEPSPQLQPYRFDPNNIYFNFHICVCCNAAPILTFGISDSQLGNCLKLPDTLWRQLPEWQAHPWGALRECVLLAWHIPQTHGNLAKPSLPVRLRRMAKTLPRSLRER